MLTHAGWSHSVNLLKPKLTTDLANHGAASRQLIICGHNMGAAIDTFVPFEILDGGLAIRPAHGSHHVVTFGTPHLSARFGSPGLKEEFLRLGRSTGGCAIPNRNHGTVLEQLS